MYKYLSMEGVITLKNKLSSLFIKKDDITNGLNPYRDELEVVAVNVRQADGVTSVGQYLDFYQTDNETDWSYNARFACLENRVLDVIGGLRPVTNNGYFLGDSSKAWGSAYINNGYFSNLYSTTGGVSVTSDERLKDMWNYPEVYDELLDLFVTKAFTYKKGASGRTHLGFSAQQLEEAVLAKGLTLKDFACVTIDEAYTYKDEEGNEIEVPEVYSIRPMEMIAMLVNRVQKQKIEYKDLLGRVEKLEGETNE